MFKGWLLLFVAVTCFGGAGDGSFEVQLTRQGTIEQVAVREDGKVFICGSFDFVAGEPRRGVARLNADGSLDRSFIPQNEGEPIAMALDEAGLLVLENVAGNATKLIRLDGEGRRTNGVSASFGGIYVDVGARIQILKRADGSMLISGANFPVGGKSFYGMVKLNADGSVDSSFSTPAAPFSFTGVSSVVENADGTFWVANQRLHKIDAQGRLLKTFDYSHVNSIVRLRDGKFLLGGSFPGIPLPPLPESASTARELIRIHADGSEDTNYIGVTSEMIAPQIHGLNDGRVLVSGYPDVSLLDGDGELMGHIALPLGLDRYGPFAEQNGKFLIGSYKAFDVLEEVKFGLARLDAGFTLDATFSMAGGITRLNEGIGSMVGLADGSAIVAGGFSFVDGRYVPGVVKLTSNGEIDTNFTANLFASTNSYAPEVALQESGNVILQGAGWSLNYSISTVERVGAEGSSTGRVIDGAICDHFRTVHALPQDYILISSLAGPPCHVGGSQAPEYRLYSDSGQYVSNIVLEREIIFPPPPPVPEMLAAVARSQGGLMSFVTPASSNSFLIGGYFSRVNGVARKGVAKVKISGEVDAAFELSATIPVPVAAIRLGADRFALLCNRPWNGQAQLILVNESGTILGQFGVDGVERIRGAGLRDNGEIVILSSSFPPNQQPGTSLSLCTVSLTGELLRKVEMGTARPTDWQYEIEPQMVVEGAGSVLVAGASTEPRTWSGVRRLSREETSAFRLDVRSGDTDVMNLRVRSPVGKAIRISKSHDLSEWSEVITTTATNAEAHEVSYSSAIRPIFFRAEMD